MWQSSTFKIGQPEQATWQQSLHQHCENGQSNWSIGQLVKVSSQILVNIVKMIKQEG